ncbi:malonyl-CoA decarboxylase [Aliiroseovarius sp.]|uniref:malonyl-CoA decarboxylase n=1 Tax=Aliiroseovarius sp. TaxID=1872442 RepID=UPI003BABDB9A
MAERSTLSHLLGRIARVGRGQGTARDPLTLCEELLGDKGEVSGLAAAMEILDGAEALNNGELAEFFEALADRFCVDHKALAKAVADWDGESGEGARAIHDISEPRSQELIRRINRAPGATARLVALRAKLVQHVRANSALRGLDGDFLHLFSSWFNRGFLELRHVDWQSPAEVLEKIISYEAVHEITGWDDLRQRVADPDRRLFAFFHPAMPDDPLIFVEVALMAEIPGAIGEIINGTREAIDPEAAKVAVFYSISNCQAGLRGISFGNFLIKQVVAELQAELPGLSAFVTLSPVPGLRRWAMAGGEGLLDDTGWMPEDGVPDEALTARIAARYLTGARRPMGTAFDPVAHFHLGNGAQLHAVHAGADPSDTGRGNSWGVMVNYLYDLSKIEANHQAYANEGEIAAAPKVRTLARK